MRRWVGRRGPSGLAVAAGLCGFARPARNGRAPRALAGGPLPRALRAQRGTGGTTRQARKQTLRAAPSGGSSPWPSALNTPPLTPTPPIPNPTPRNRTPTPPGPRVRHPRRAGAPQHHRRGRLRQRRAAGPAHQERVHRRGGGPLGGGALLRDRAHPQQRADQGAGGAGRGRLRQGWCWGGPRALCCLWGGRVWGEAGLGARAWEGFGGGPGTLRGRSSIGGAGRSRGAAAPTGPQNLAALVRPTGARAHARAAAPPGAVGAAKPTPSPTPHPSSPPPQR